MADALDAEALAQAQEIEVKFGEVERTVKTRVLRPEHLVAIALRLGRPKDLIRIAQFLEEEAVDTTVLCDILDRHKLSESWRRYCARVGVENPCPARGTYEQIQARHISGYFRYPRAQESGSTQYRAIVIWRKDCPR